MASGKRKRKRTGLAGTIELLGITLIIGLVAYMMFANTKKLRAQEQEYSAREAALEQEIEAQNERTEELTEQKKYVKTDRYIEEVAREKLGLINPDEILFKEKDD